MLWRGGGEKNLGGSRESEANKLMSDIRGFLEDMAREAGELAMGYFGHVHVEAKGTSIVSEADRAVERFLVSRIRSRHPADYILGEESGAHGPAWPGPNTQWWAVDPIDGTGPYLARLPFWSISVACLRGPAVVAAVVYLAALDEMFSAVRGKRAHRNGETVKPVPQDVPGRHSYLFIPCKAVPGLQVNYPGREISLAASSLHLSYAAAGSAFGALIEPNCAYDIAAASLILEEAGGAIRYASGREIDFAELADGRRMPEPAVAAPAERIDWLRRRVTVS